MTSGPNIAINKSKGVVLCPAYANVKEGLSAASPECCAPLALQHSAEIA